MRFFQRFAPALVLLALNGLANAGDDAETLKKLAIETLKRNIVTAQTEPDATKRHYSLRNAGANLNKLGEPIAALAAYLKAFEADKLIRESSGYRPNPAVFAYELDKIGAKDEGLEVLREALKAIVDESTGAKLYGNTFFRIQTEYPQIIWVQFDIEGTEAALKSLERYERLIDLFGDPQNREGALYEKLGLLAHGGLISRALIVARTLEADPKIVKSPGSAFLLLAQTIPERFPKEIDAAFDEARVAILADTDSARRNENIYHFVDVLRRQDRLDRAIELTDAIVADDPKFDRSKTLSLKYGHAEILAELGMALLKRKDKTKAIEFARKSFAMCAEMGGNRGKKDPLKRVLIVFHDAGDVSGVADTFAALTEIPLGADPADYWIAADAFGTAGDKKKARAVLNRCLVLIDQRIETAQNYRPSHRTIVPSPPLEILSSAIAEQAETHFLLGDRAAAEVDINSLDLAKRDTARAAWALFRVQANDVATALEVLHAIKDTARRDDAVIEAALKWKTRSK